MRATIWNFLVLLLRLFFPKGKPGANERTGRKVNGRKVENATGFTYINPWSREMPKPRFASMHLLQILLLFLSIQTEPQKVILLAYYYMDMRTTGQNKSVYWTARPPKLKRSFARYYRQIIIYWICIIFVIIGVYSYAPNFMWMYTCACVLSMQASRFIYFYIYRKAQSSDKPKCTKDGAHSHIQPDTCAITGQCAVGGRRMEI